MRRSSRAVQNVMGLMAMIGIALFVCGCAKKEYDPVEGFNQAMTQRKGVSEARDILLQLPKTDQWRLSKYWVDYEVVDVKKNDSLVNPYSGVVTISFHVGYSEKTGSLEQAKAFVIPHEGPALFTATLEYIGSEKGWSLREGAYFFNKELEYTFSLTPQRIKTTAGVPFAQLIDWL